MTTMISRSNSTGGESYDLSTLQGANAFIELKKGNRKHIANIGRDLQSKGIVFLKSKSRFIQVYEKKSGVVSESTFVPFGIWYKDEGEVLPYKGNYYVCAWNIEWAKTYFETPKLAS